MNRLKEIVKKEIEYEKLILAQIDQDMDLDKVSKEKVRQRVYQSYDKYCSLVEFEEY